MTGEDPNIIPFEAFLGAFDSGSEAMIGLEFIPTSITHSKTEIDEYIRSNQDIVSELLDFSESVYVWWWMKALLNLRIDGKDLVTLSESRKDYEGILDNAFRLIESKRKTIIGLLGSSDNAPIMALMKSRAEWVHHELVGKITVSTRILQHYRTQFLNVHGRFFRDFGFDSEYFI